MQPLGVYLLEYHTAILHDDNEIVLMRRVNALKLDNETRVRISPPAVIRLRHADVDTVQRWFALLRAGCLQSARRVFGVPLDELEQREHRRAVVPQLVHSAITWLRRLDTSPPGLFERAG